MDGSSKKRAISVSSSTPEPSAKRPLLRIKYDPTKDPEANARTIKHENESDEESDEEEAQDTGSGFSRVKQKTRLILVSGDRVLSAEKGDDFVEDETTAVYKRKGIARDNVADEEEIQDRDVDAEEDDEFDEAGILIQGSQPTEAEPIPSQIVTYEPINDGLMRRITTKKQNFLYMTPLKLNSEILKNARQKAQYTDKNDKSIETEYHIWARNKEVDDQNAELAERQKELEKRMKVREQEREKELRKRQKELDDQRPRGMRRKSVLPEAVGDEVEVEEIFDQDLNEPRRETWAREKFEEIQKIKEATRISVMAESRQILTERFKNGYELKLDKIVEGYRHPEQVRRAFNWILANHPHFVDHALWKTADQFFAATMCVINTYPNYQELIFIKNKDAFIVELYTAMTLAQRDENERIALRRSASSWWDMTGRGIMPGDKYVDQYLPCQIATDDEMEKLVDGVFEYEEDEVTVDEIPRHSGRRMDIYHRSFTGSGNEVHDFYRSADEPMVEGLGVGDGRHFRGVNPGRETSKKAQKEAEKERS